VTGFFFRKSAAKCAGSSGCDGVDKSANICRQYIARRVVLPLLLHLQIGQKGGEQIKEAEGKREPWEDHLLPLSELAARVDTVASLPVAACAEVKNSIFEPFYGDFVTRFQNSYMAG
jgi:hypothetical protein